MGIFLNYQNGTFAPQMTCSTGSGSRPYSVSVGDLNNDTHVDIAVANFGTNSIVVLLGYGNGTFATPIITALGPSRPLSLVLGDFNNDSALDLAVANYGTSTVAVLIGENNGSFRIGSVYQMGYDSVPYSVAIADLNQDIRLDILAVNYGINELVILLTGNGTSFIMNKYFTGHGSHPSSVTSGDFNNDNQLDIAVAYSGTSSIGIFLGNEDGTFTDPVIHLLSARSRPQFIAVGDFNNDTVMDIAVVDSEYDNILILKGYGNGSFSITTTHSTGYNSDPCAIVVGDFDNDHKPDVAVANNGTNNVLVLISYLIYPATTHTQYSIEASTQRYSIGIADFNEDNYLDIVVSNTDTNDVSVFFNLDNGTFTDQHVYSMGDSSGPVYVVTGDVNNDHHQDIIVSLSKISSIGILLGFGDGTYFDGDTLSTERNSYPHTIAVGDLDNDGNLDIVSADYNVGHLGLFFGFGDGSFTNLTVILNKIGFYPDVIEVSDVNNDTILDVVASNGYGVNIVVLLGYGDGSFDDPIFISTDGDAPNTFTIGDLNNDGRVDIVYTSNSFSYFGILFGEGNGTFRTVTKYFCVRGSYPWSISLGHYNDDSFIDIAVSLYFDTGINIYLGIGNGSFRAPTRLSTGDYSRPAYLRIADFNNDHQDDIVVASNVVNAIQIFLVHYDADFTSETSYMTGSSPHPASISIGDLNNNGQSDVVLANPGSDDLELLLRYNNGIFVERMIFSTGDGSHPQSVTIADFNQDNFFDIAVVNAWQNNMNVFLGLGNESFDTRRVYSTGLASAPNSIVAGDLNKDGRMDVVVVNEMTDNVAVFLAFDYVSFTNHIIYEPGAISTPYYVSSGDFNNDHLVDIAIININAHNLGIYLGYGNGTFSDQITYSTGQSSKPISLGVGDFDNDSCLDVVVANSGIHTIVVFLGYCNGSFQSPISYSTGDSSTPSSVAVADFNKDNRLDIIVTENKGNNVWVFLGYGNGSFSGEIIYSMPDQSYSAWVVVDDLNNDTIPDVVVANQYANNVCILFGDGNGSFGNVTMLPTGEGSRPASVALGDFNGDKSIDIAVVNQFSKTVGLFFGYRNGSFSSQKTYPVSAGAYLKAIIVSDINNDTALDILVVDYDRTNSSLAIFYGLGDGNFTLPKIYPTGFNSLPYMVATGDFNNDGKVDLAMNYWNQDSIGVFIQVSSEPFGSSALFSTGNQSHPKSVAIGDFNNDHRLDIAVTSSATNNIGILLGYGNGDFADQLTYSTGTDFVPSAISVDHFNDDDYLDIAVVNTNIGTVSIFVGYGNGSFRQMVTYSSGFGSTPVAIAAKDMNKDSYPDLVVANRGSNEVLIFVGIGDGTFLPPKSYSIGYDTRPQSVAIADINNDGKLDIAVGNYGSDYFQILLQTC